MRYLPELLIPPALKTVFQISGVLFGSVILVSQVSDPKTSAKSLMLDPFACLGVFTTLVVSNFSFSIIPNTFP